MDVPVALGGWSTQNIRISSTPDDGDVKLVMPIGGRLIADGSATATEHAPGSTVVVIKKR